MHRIQVTAAGGPEAIEWVEGPEPEPRDDAVIVDVAAAGLNFIDTYQRSGLYPMQFPFTPGLEGAGTVLWAPEGSGHAAGDRVAWAGAPGSYAQRVAVPVAQAVRVPDTVPLESAAAVMLQGITAHFLATDTFPLGPSHRCLIHAGAGGVGQFLIQIAKHLGAEVFTTVGSESKAELARHAGADHVIDYSQTDFGDAVESIAGSRPLDVVYDGVGKAVFDRSLTLLRKRGMMVTFGNASGPADPVSPLTLMREGSLFLTRPTMFDYLSDRTELERRTGDLFSWIADGWLHVRIGARVSMAEAAEAHRMLESRQTTGKVILVP